MTVCQFTTFFSSGIKRFVSGLFLSRLTGLGRDLIMAYAFGDHPTVASFMMVFRFSNLLRRFFGEGPLQSVFVPHFQGLRSRDPQQAYAFFRKLTFFLFVAVTVVVVCIEGSLTLFLTLPSFAAGTREVMQMMRDLIPCLILACLYGLNLSLLQCHNAFFLPNVAPAICNLVWMSGACYLKRQGPEVGVLFLVHWVLAGFFFQWAMTVPFVWRIAGRKLKQWVQWNIGLEVKKIVCSFRWVALGVGAAQINGCLDTIFARCADLSGPVYLWYASRFHQLALAMFGMATVHTLVPLFSRKIKEGRMEEGKEMFAFGMRLILTLMLVCTIGILALGDLLIDVVYGRGRFSHHAVTQTVRCLWAYSLGLIPSSLIMLQSAVFYARERARTPANVAGISVGLNIFLNGLCVFVLKLSPASVAWATSASLWVHFFILHFLLRHRNWKWHYPCKDLLRLFIGCLLAWLLTSVSSLVIVDVGKLFAFVCRLAIFLLTLFTYAYLRTSRDLHAAFKVFFARG